MLLRRDARHRERQVASRLQTVLQEFYALDAIPAIEDYLHHGAGDVREVVWVRDPGDGTLEVAVMAPHLSPEPYLDRYCQMIEGVSHFIYLAERARTRLPLTQLELELQAEIDKYVVLVLLRSPFERSRSRALHERLYERVTYLAAEGTVEGDRYRLANELAARLVHRLDTSYAARGRFLELRHALMRFYRMGQAEKIGLARAA